MFTSVQKGCLQQTTDSEERRDRALESDEKMAQGSALQYPPHEDLSPSSFGTLRCKANHRIRSKPLIRRKEEIAPSKLTKRWRKGPPYSIPHMKKRCSILFWHSPLLSCFLDSATNKEYDNLSTTPFEPEIFGLFDDKIAH